MNQQDEAVLTIYERSKPGRRAAVLPDAEVPETPLEELIPANLLREEPPSLPEVSEPEIVRHYNRLSRRNFDLDTGFYPLGSCTMKHNPRLNERVAALPGHARLHPAQDPERAQGALELMWLLQQSLGEICGLPHVSLQPSAGSHGELAGLLLTRAFHADRGEERTKVLAPDTSHGTNPASVTMAGYEAVKVGTNEDGGVDIDDLKAKVSDDVACLMLTNPNTLGVFDENIAEIAGLIHEAGGTLYYDGANLNAVMGHSRPGDMGFDIVHVNLHKSFSQPHGGGGPGAGPIAVSDRIEPFLPRPQVVRREGDNGSGPHFDLDLDRPKSIGRLRGFQGNFGVFVRSYAYILSLGADGLAEASETAVLNANYLKARLAEGRAGKHLPVAFERHCMHEFVLSGRPMKRELGVATLDLAKRLLDFGFHPPTVYFPLLVEEALMVEPTETETKESLDGFAEAIERILAEAEGDPDVARQAPYTTPGPPPRRGQGDPQARRPPAALSVKVELLNVGWMTAPAGVWRQGEEDPGRPARVPVSAYLIETDSERILVDTGLNPGAVADRVGHYSESIAIFELEQEESIADQVDLGSLSRVVLTHLHFDHAGGLELVPESVPIVIQRAEWEAGHDDAGVELNFFQPRDYAGQDREVILVDGDHDLLGDGSIELLSTPGHSTGHQSVRVGELVIGADVAHYADVLDDPRFPAFAADFDAQRRSAERLRGLRDAGLRVLPGHDPEVMLPGTLL